MTFFLFVEFAKRSANFLTGVIADEEDFRTPRCGTREAEGRLHQRIQRVNLETSDVRTESNPCSHLRTSECGFLEWKCSLGTEARVSDIVTYVPELLVSLPIATSQLMR